LHFDIYTFDGSKVKVSAKTASRPSYQAQGNRVVSALASVVLWMPASNLFLLSIAMQVLSTVARSILDRMEPDRHYEAPDLRAFVPNASAETLREVMHELWVNRQVERVGLSGWQRHRSAPPHQSAVDAKRDAASGYGQTKVVKPEDLFDHDSFTDFFR
jgi:hypothetical protein